MGLFALRAPPSVFGRHPGNRINPGQKVAGIFLRANGTASAVNVNGAALGKRVGIVHPVDDPYPFAESSPIYVHCGGRPIRSEEDARYFLTWIDAISRMAAEDRWWRSEGEKAHVLSQFQEARKVFEQRLREAQP